MLDMVNAREDGAAAKRTLVREHLWDPRRSSPDN